MPKAKLKAVITVIYEADPENYDTTSPTKMADIDQQSLDEGNIYPEDILNWGDIARVQITTFEGRI